MSGTQKDIRLGEYLLLFAYREHYIRGDKVAQCARVFECEGFFAHIGRNVLRLLAVAVEHFFKTCQRRVRKNNGVADSFRHGEKIVHKGSGCRKIGRSSGYFDYLRPFSSLGNYSDNAV